jgi:hypothetical protein
MTSYCCKTCGQPLRMHSLYQLETCAAIQRASPRRRELERELADKSEHKFVQEPTVEP